MGKLSKASLMLISLLTIACITGYFYQKREIIKDIKTYPPLGNILEVDGIKYHLNCAGEGSPAVILEAGWGESSLSWYPVQDTISKTTRVCSYDRAGLGWSEGTDKLFSVNDVALQLHKLLLAGEVKPPYIMVGHSRGGIYVRSFYHQFSNEVKGIVLVDSSHEQSLFRTYAYFKTDYAMQKIQTIIAVPLSKIGFIRIMGWLDADRQKSPLPPEIVKAKSAVQNSTKTVQAAVNETLVMREGLNPTTPPPLSLGDLPLIVLTASKADEEDVKNNTEIEKLESNLQKELAALSSSSKHIISHRSGHYMMYDEPELVVNLVLSMVKTVQ